MPGGRPRDDLERMVWMGGPGARPGGRRREGGPGAGGRPGQEGLEGRTWRGGS